MRINRPIYRSLPVCRGRSDDEIDKLTKQVYRRAPRLILYPLLAAIVCFPIAMWLPRPLAEWVGIDFSWSLLICGVLFGAPMLIYERWLHRPAVNQEMEKLIAEQMSDSRVTSQLIL